MILLGICVIVTLVGLVVSIAGPVRCLYGLSYLEVLFKLGRKRPGIFHIGDTVEIVRLDHPLFGQRMKIAGYREDGTYWAIWSVGKRWLSRGCVEASDLELLKQSWRW